MCNHKLMTSSISFAALSGSACRSRRSKSSPSTGILFIIITLSCCFFCCTPAELHCTVMWRKYTLLGCPPPAIFPIVWVHRIMADLQSLNRGWLLQGSTPSVAKAAPRTYHFPTAAAHQHTRPDQFNSVASSQITNTINWFPLTSSSSSKICIHRYPSPKTFGTCLTDS